MHPKDLGHVRPYTILPFARIPRGFLNHRFNWDVHWAIAKDGLSTGLPYKAAAPKVSYGKVRLLVSRHNDHRGG